MQTRCPACQTLYRIDEDVLKRAGGQARCFRCDTVFDAYRNPAESSADDSAPDTDTDLAEAPLELSTDSESLSELSALTELPAVPDPSGLEADSELDLDDLADSLRQFEPAAVEATPDADAASEQEDDALTPLPPLNALDDPAAPGSAAEPPPVTPAGNGPPAARLATILPGALAAALLILALAQLAWFNREQVLATPQGQAVAQAACGVLDCELPPRRAPSRYAVLDRNIGADDEQPGALVMHLSFRNGADFSQPLPDIQLSLYDSEEQLMARRRLHPDEYLFPAPPGDTLVEPDGVVQVVLRLEDPGRHATGFKLEFL